MPHWKPPEMPAPANLTREPREDLPPLDDEEMASAKREGRRLAMIGIAMDLRQQSGRPALPEGAADEGQVVSPRSDRKD